MVDETVEQEQSLEEQMASRTSKPTKKDKKKAAKKAVVKGKAKAKSAGQKKSSGKGGIRRVGVIAAILEMIGRADGASFEEISNHLEKKFKDRDAKGMKTTARIQLTRLPKKHGFELKKTKDEKRGLVYKAPSALVQKILKEAKSE